MVSFVETKVIFSSGDVKRLSDIEKFTFDSADLSTTFKVECPQAIRNLQYLRLYR